MNNNLMLTALLLLPHPHIWFFSVGTIFQKKVESFISPIWLNCPSYVTPSKLVIFKGGRYHLLRGQQKKTSVGATGIIFS